MNRVHRLRNVGSLLGGGVAFWSLAAFVWAAEPAASASTSSAAPVRLASKEGVPSFALQVQAMLTKAGCNMGTCHGNANGKGGFKLSLRGEDVASDFEILTRQALGRRTNLESPAESLLLEKPLMVVPHEGGRRLEKEGLPYQVMLDWVKAGQPDDVASAPKLLSVSVEPPEAYLEPTIGEVQLKVVGTFSDGVRRDVTEYACYDTTHRAASVDAHGRVVREQFGEANILVRYLGLQAVVPIIWIPPRPDFVWPEPPAEHLVDRRLEEKLRRLRVAPAPLCEDHVFLRRAYLDVVGVPPTADEAKRFLADVDPDKRAKLVDELLARPAFAEFWAQKWSDLLRVEERTLDRKGVQTFYAWLRRSLAEDKPLNEFAAELVASEGSTYTAPATNYYRALREPYARAETTAQVFLGVRLQCARCHNHPFDRWTQTDYYSWTNLFTRIDYKVLSNLRPDDNDKHQFDGEQIVYEGEKPDVEHPKTGSAPRPRLLGAGSDLAKGGRLPQLGKWLADPANPFFGPMQANRIWFHLMGRGIVDPIDDFRPTNPASHPELLNDLAAYFAKEKFSTKKLIRLVMTSRAYQRAVLADDAEMMDDSTFARGAPRRAPAESLLDGLHQVCGVPTQFINQPVGTRATQLAGISLPTRKGPKPTMDDDFLRAFGKPPRLLACECERSAESTLLQSMQMVSGPVVEELIGASQNRLGKMLDQKLPAEAMVDELFWESLSRAPSDKERAKAVDWILKSPSPRLGLEDVLWSLVNSKEFLLRP